MLRETMYDCYVSQFDCLGRILDNKDSLLEGFAAYYRSIAPDRLYLVGSGTSHNACAAAAPFMEKVLGVEVTAVAPTCMGNLYGQRPLLIAVSQGGRSTNTVAFIKRLRQKGAPVVTLTDPTDTPVGNAGSFALPLQAQNEQVGPKTRGYMATVLMLYLMALEAGLDKGSIPQADAARYLEQYREVVRRGGEYLAACQSFYDVHVENLKKGRTLLFVGKGVSAKVASEDALKVLETLCYPSIGYEFEEFLHGPACCTDENLTLFMFLTQDEDAARMQKAVSMVTEVTSNAYMISHDPTIRGDKTLYLPVPDSVYLSPFTDILFGQLLSAKLTEALGRERHPSVKDVSSRMGIKAPNA